MTAEEQRNQFREYIEREVTGPREVDEVLSVDPWLHYIAGVLFPREKNLEEEVDFITAEDGGESDSSSDTTVAEQVTTLAGKLFPSSIGIEVQIGGERRDANITINYAIYQKNKEKKWQRYALQFCRVVSSDDRAIIDYPLDNTTGFVRVIQRKHAAFTSLKVFVVNGVEESETAHIYQPEIRISPRSHSALLPFRFLREKTGELEDQQLYTRYRKHRVFGAAYGCSVQWEEGEKESCEEVYSTFNPFHEIHPLDFSVEGDESVLSLHFLAYTTRDDHPVVIKRLNDFVDRYSRWIDQLIEQNGDLDPDSPVVKTTIKACRMTEQRMRQGIRLIEEDSLVRHAFMLSNLAMLMQNAHRRNEVKPAFGFEPWEHCKTLVEGYSWRPFQLAFILLSIDPASNPDSSFREIVDLIWFPTGGGKTEAYLGVASFTIFLSRLRKPDAHFGTTVISRYTLRLLTTQQFERTSALVCCLELIRSTYPGELGETPIRLGLWLGSKMTPNSIRFAEEKHAELLQETRPLENNPFILNVCPCCNTPLLPERQDEEEAYGFSVEGPKLWIRCLDSSCPMSEGIPVAIVDDQIYEELPTIVIGTIDKFARLAWIERAGWLLNGKNGQVSLPSLIIQDELHLIAGPLGSLAGVYETAIEALCSSDGKKPHIIASTATVRRANEQCMALYGRNVSQFPSPGLDEIDSFFAKVEKEKPGRMYLGILPPHVTATTAAVRLHAILLQAPLETGSLEDSDNDNYWTLVSYFNSIKELGAATTLAADDIPDRLQVIQQDPAARRSLKEVEFTDLYSQKEGSELRDIFTRLDNERSVDNSLSLVLTTNIISVGVDVDRLGLMLVNGQPKTTAEYIQATSRVGRSAAMPGLVVTLFSATKPRDRSHYESFKSYHSSIYSYVEPTSVTPFSKPSRHRALHAIMVILARHLPDGLPENDQAAEIDRRLDLLERVCEIIKERVGLSASPEYDESIKELDFLTEQWRGWAAGELHYDATRNAISTLLHRDIEPTPSQIGWHTMDAMRSVDFETRIRIEGEPS
jgi:hypothetical protein